MTTVARKNIGPGWLALLLLAWGAVVVAGFAALAVHQNRAGAGALAPAVEKPAPKPRLLVFLHPECPCSRATLTELGRILDTAGAKVDARAHVYAPKKMGEAWAKGALYQSAKKLSGLRVELDPDGSQARAYDAKTSGQTLLYSAEGRLVFSGGITGSRGHEGENAGQRAVQDFLLTGRLGPKNTSVFGCSLR